MFSCTGINGSSISILANSLHHSTALTELSFNFGYANYFTKNTTNDSGIQDLASALNVFKHLDSLTIDLL